VSEWLELTRSLGISDDVARFMWETDEFVIASGRVVLLSPMPGEGHVEEHRPIAS
jgi:hypothetical protein